MGTPPVGVIVFGGPTDGHRKTNAQETLEEAGGAIAPGRACLRSRSVSRDS